MLPETIFAQMSSAGLNYEQSVHVTRMLFEALEAGFDKAMEKLDEMRASSGHQFFWY